MNRALSLTRALTHGLASVLGLVTAGSLAVACGAGSVKVPPGLDSNDGSTGTGGDAGVDGYVSNPFQDSSVTFDVPVGGGGGGGGGGVTFGDGGVPCPTGTTCTNSCASTSPTTLTGHVYDPAGKNPLYNAVVYIPATTPAALPSGATCDSCDSLYTGTPVAVATTDTTGKFTMTNVPVTGDSVPIVVQIGKWRTQTTTKITACSNTNDTGNLKLPSKHGPGADIPDIAVSTGSADSLECLLTRIGIDSSEYVAGASTAGRIHIFNGGGSTSGGGFGGGGGDTGRPEANPMSGAPNSSDPGGLWDSQADLMKFDIVLLSCEGGETYNAVPANLESYLNAGGRVFGSHFHYAWFSGPISSGQSYSAPSDWGTNLATWQADGKGGGSGKTAIGGEIVTTFPKGNSLKEWLGGVSALGTDGVAAGELAVYQPKHNADVSASNKPSQPWINADSSSGMSGATLYFSFDTPVNAPEPTDGGAPAYCGRAVFSDLHVGGAPTTDDTVNSSGGGGFGGGGGAGSPPPAGCDNVDLSAQEKALEFMLFDLSSCVIPDSVTPSGPTVGGVH